MCERGFFCDAEYFLTLSPVRGLASLCINTSNFYTHTHIHTHTLHMYVVALKANCPAGFLEPISVTGCWESRPVLVLYEIEMVAPESRMGLVGAVRPGSRTDFLIFLKWLD